MSNYDVKIIEINDKEYPTSLKQITNPPKKLYIAGNIENLNKKGISIIGSRNCSEKGKELAKKFSYDLSKSGFVITSGMAKGIDTAAHIGALNAKGRTIAVLGGGFNHIFPKENTKLFEEIIKSEGTIISEYPLDVSPESKNFIQRNRIVSGLSLALLVIEAKRRSGTSITAEFARKQNKKIFCIAHGLGDSTGEGTNRLIKKGAYIVTNLEDITSKFDFVKKIKVENRKDKILEIPKQYLEIYRYIQKDINTTDEIIKRTKRNIKEINYILTMLELENHIYKYQGKFYIKEQ